MKNDRRRFTRMENEVERNRSKVRAAWWTAMLWIALTCGGAHSVADDLANRTLPESVKVLPVLFVPQGQPPPTPTQLDTVMRHLRWAQTRYRELLHDEATFAIAEPAPKVFQSPHPIESYRNAPGGSAAQFTSELLADLKCNRYTCPYVLLIIVKNDEEYFPVGGGRPLNGGFNNGGGMVELSTYNFEHSAGFQNTLQHELGHAFGLAHPDAYGYSMATNDSFMSYNAAFYTDGFNPSRTPGKLIPEDLRALGWNQRVFAGYRFDSARDVPTGYAMHDPVPFGAMDIPGQEGFLPFDEKLAREAPLHITVRRQNGGNMTDNEPGWNGSAGPGQKMRGFSVTVQKEIPGVRLQYMAHAAMVGDTGWSDAGTFLSGGEQVEGIAFRLTGPSSDKYDVWYRAHLANVGDTSWCKNGEFCGTRGEARPLEAFAVAIIPR